MGADRRRDGEGRVVVPREVFNELQPKDDEVCAWAKERVELFVEPTAEVQRAAGVVLACFQTRVNATGPILS
jgi:hypothetical protein